MKNNEEIWKDIEGYENKYQVSSLGRVKSLKRNLIMKETNHHCGYLKVELYKDGIGKKIFVHRLVAKAFISNPNNLPEVNHIDENKKNNNVNNLEWCNSKYNSNYGTRLFRKAESKKKKVLQYSLDVKLIKEWKSATDIQKETGFEKGSIGRCCRNQQYQAYGYIWRYANEDKN